MANEGKDLMILHDLSIWLSQIHIWTDLPADLTERAPAEGVIVILCLSVEW